MGRQRAEASPVTIPNQAYSGYCRPLEFAAEAGIEPPSVSVAGLPAGLRILLMVAAPKPAAAAAAATKPAVRKLVTLFLAA